MVACPVMPRSILAPTTQFEVRVLNSREIIAAKKLIYQVLVVEQNWRIPPDNPSQIRVDSEILCDAYDSTATWFGVFHNNTLIACNRSIGQLQGNFELENYHPLPTFLKSNQAALELNRLAVKKEYRTSCAVLVLARGQLQYFLANGVNALFTTSVFPRPGNFYVRRFGFIKDDLTFRYHPDDSHAVHLLHMDIDRMKETLVTLTNSIERYALSSF